MYELDSELEQALYSAFTREAAPRDLVARVEAQLFAARTAAEVPAFRMLSFPARNRWTSLLSIGAHASVFALIVLVVFGEGARIESPKKLSISAVDVKPFIPEAFKVLPSMGGGGGGAHETIEASKGRLPKIAKVQILPPQILRNDNPKLAVDPTIVMPQLIKLPDENMPNIGLPTSPQVALESQGPGSGSGFGIGKHGGMGSGNGSGLGPGAIAGNGGGVMRAGATAPQIIYEPDPEFTDEARRVKYQGICVVSVIVDTQGNPQNVHVIRPLGMGLDQKAVEAVQHYKFKPAMYQGHPVAVEVDILVDFHIL